MTCPPEPSRIGRRMREILRIVDADPGMSKGQAVRAAGDDIHRNTWYRAILHCQRQGLITAERDGNRYRLTVTDKGKTRLTAPGEAP